MSDTDAARRRGSEAEENQIAALPSAVLAKKRFGQHFLTDQGVIRRIIRAFGPRAGETVIEIGPGRGALTAQLLDAAGRLVAVEFDRDLVPLLRERFGSLRNFTLIEGDALAVDFCAAIRPAAQARVIANLPYNIATAILQRLIEQRHCLTEMVLMLQREVVERLTAPPASRARGFISVFTQAYCVAGALFDVPPGAFRPAPKVWSTVVRLRVRPRLAVDVSDEALLWRAVSAGFAQRRKTLLNNLRHAPHDLRARIEEAGGTNRLLEAAHIAPARRAETLTLDEWARLANALAL